VQIQESMIDCNNSNSNDVEGVSAPSTENRNQWEVCSEVHSEVIANTDDHRNHEHTRIRYKSVSFRDVMIQEQQQEQQQQYPTTTTVAQDMIHDHTIRSDDDPNHHGHPAADPATTIRNRNLNRRYSTAQIEPPPPPRRPQLNDVRQYTSMRQSRMDLATGCCDDVTRERLVTEVTPRSYRNNNNNGDGGGGFGAGRFWSIVASTVWKNTVVQPSVTASSSSSTAAALSPSTTTTPNHIVHDGNPTLTIREDSARTNETTNDVHEANQKKNENDVVVRTNPIGDAADNAALVTANPTSPSSSPSASSPSASTSVKPSSGNKEYRIRSRSQRDQSFWMSQTQTLATAMSNYVTWTYRSAFWLALLSSYALFMVLMFLFAICIYWAGMVQPQCIVVGTSTFSGNFMDAFQLSWTTLATVGFGIIGPQSPSSDQRWYVFET
jgi:hypothetical protein